MGDGMRFEAVKLDLDDLGRGTLTLRVPALADYRGVLAHLQSNNGQLFGPDGRARRLQLHGLPPEQPMAFPCDVALAVIEQPLRHDDVTERMLLNFFRRLRVLDVIAFDPPAEDGKEGLLRVECRTEEDYLEIRGLVDEERGACLRSLHGGGVWYVHRLDDDAQPGRPFPQNVSVRVEWLKR